MPFEATSLSSLVEKLAHTDLLLSEDLIQITRKIRSYILLLPCADSRRDAMANVINDHDKSLFVRKLHRTLILYIGVFLGHHKRTLVSNTKQVEVLSSLIFCLRDLYTTNIKELSRYDGEGEFNEVFVLIPKILLHALSEGFKTANTIQSNVRHNVIIPCYQIIKSWLNAPIFLKKVLLESTATKLENFILSLLKSKITINATGSVKQDVDLELFERLRLLCDYDCDFRKMLDVAKSVTHSFPSTSYGKLSPRLIIFLWRCMFCVLSNQESMISKNTKREIADRAVNAMMPYIDSEHSKKATACISEFILISSDESRIRLIKYATNRVTNASASCVQEAAGDIKENTINETLISTLECFGFCMEESSTTDYLLGMKNFDVLLEKLVLWTMQDKSTDIAEKSVVILMTILKVLISSPDHSTPILVRKSINILLKIISLHHPRVVGKALELLFTLSQNSETRRLIVSSTLSIDLLNALALLASKNIFTDEKKKSELAKTFSVLVQEKKHIHFLAKKSSRNLAFLVRLANGSYCENGQSQVQQISICMIVKLSRNPCNQRILAREPGLLSSLIQYARTAPENSEIFSDKHVSRNEIKERIVIMANTL